MDLLGQQGCSEHPDQEHGPGPGQVQDQGQLGVPSLDLVSGGVQGKYDHERGGCYHHHQSHHADIRVPRGTGLSGSLYGEHTTLTKGS